MQFIQEFCGAEDVMKNFPKEEVILGCAQISFNIIEWSKKWKGAIFHGIKMTIGRYHIEISRRKKIPYP